ncbi:MAG: iron donor protein CyaY [Bacteriovoracia bacterium]
MVIPMLSEAEYRQLIQKAFARVEAAFENVDPDAAECEPGLGTLAIVFGGKSKLILSTQPSLRQLWVAFAAKGIAHHFNHDIVTGQWIDDKGKGIELYAFLRETVREMARLEISF